MVKQPPCISDAVNLPSRAFFDTSINSRESSIMPFLFTFLNTGTTKPFGVSTATPMLIYFFRIKRCASSVIELLKRGYASNAFATAFIMNTTGVIFTPSFCFSANAFCSLRNASKSVISALSK